MVFGGESEEKNLFARSLEITGKIVKMVSKVTQPEEKGKKFGEKRGG